MSIDNMMEYKGYYAKPEYSVEDHIFYGKIIGISDLVDFYTEDAKEIEHEFHSAVEDYLTFCSEVGKDPDRAYSGRFNVRISPDLHRKISLVAQAEGVSLNKAVEQAIAAFT